MTVDPLNPAPGVYDSIPFATYLQIKAVNKSSLDWLHDYSPMHLNWARRQPEEDTKATRIGKAYHCLVLRGREAFDAEFVVPEQCGATKKDGERCSNTGIVEFGGYWLCGVHAKSQPAAKAPAGTVLLGDEAGTVFAMADKTKACPPAAKFLASPGQNELTLVWKDPETGLLCKAQVDLLRPTWSAIGDLKTTECASPKKFARSMDDYGYCRQAAFYLDGARELDLPVEHFAFIPVEKGEPHGVATYQVDAASAEKGRDEIRTLLRRYAECEAAGVWPGYDAEFPLLALPAWAMRREAVLA